MTEQVTVATQERLIATWTDEEILVATRDELPSDADQRLSELLGHQQARTLSENERPELVRLLEMYSTRWFRKAQALREAVRRGLMEPLQP